MRWLKNQRGSIAVLSVLAITMLIAMAALVVDVGMLYLAKVQLANAVDAAALAGVQKLPTNPFQAIVVAHDYARRNKLPPNTQILATVGDHGGIELGKITVTARQSLGMAFARILGIAQVDISASAQAAVRPFGGGTGVVPFGVVRQDFIKGQAYALKEGAGSDGLDSSKHHGNFGALALGGTGANVYEDNIKYGSQVKVSVGDWELTKPGNMSGPTTKGVSYRVGLDPTATYDTVTEGSPRIIIVPVIDSLDVNGRGYVQVVDFAVFFLEGTMGQGKDNYVIGRFRERLVTAGDPGTSGNYGVYTATLIK